MNRRSPLLLGLLSLSLLFLSACSAGIATNGSTAGSGSSTAGSSSGSGGLGLGSADAARRISAPLVPKNAIVVNSIQALGNWIAVHDPATGSSSSGIISMTGSPSLSGNALQFDSSYTDYGGELYYSDFGTDTLAKNFLYDGWVYLTDSASSIAVIEMDMNEVMPNGQTVIFGFQCDSWSGTWDYTENAGTPTDFIDKWVNSSAPCNVQNWAKNTWHHVQISYSRDDYGNVTYQSVWLDGKKQQINATVPSAFALGWSPALITNFQVDSFESGTASSTVFVDNLSVSRW